MVQRSAGTGAGAGARLDDLVFRPFHEDDLEALLGLFQAAFPRWPRVDVSVEPIEHLRWKMRLDETEERRSNVAELDGKIIAGSVSVSARAKLRDRIVLCSHGSDTAVHPAYQGQGVLSKRRQRSRSDQSEFTLMLGGKSTHPAMIGARRHNTRNRELIGNPTERYVRPLTWAGLSSTTKLRWRRSPPKLVRSLRQTVGWLAGRARSASGDTATCSVSDAASFDDRVDALWEAGSQRFDFAFVRDLQHLNWRFADKRGGNFTIKLAEQDEVLLGYAVLCGESDGDKGYLADLLVLPDRLDVTRALVRSALGHFRRTNRALVECWLPRRHPYRSALDRLGFLRRPQTRYAGAYLPMGAPEEELAFLKEPDARIHLTLGDTDVV
jgi:GNAT superfamily N-acetyltransferase